ncbi:MAG TPA: AAA family ATPase [Chitinophagaceae bacterium]|nr:AAA family ATPase [Chitinophagaceae bacterium]
MRRIVIIGPESTGKSTLCEGLAAHYATAWCPEYARAYLEEHGPDYTYADLLTIARGQLSLEKEKAVAARNGLYFVDTDQYVMKVWCEVVFGNCHSWILRALAAHRPDYYLLCNNDLPWVPDGLREYPDPAARHRLFRMYLDIVVNSGVPWSLVSGSESGVRLQRAVNIVDSVFPNVSFQAHD